MELQKEASKWHNFKRYATPVGGTLFLALIGSLYIAGNISPYISIYFGVTTDQTSNIMPATFAAQALTIPVGSYFVQKGVEPKLLLTIGTVIFFCMQMVANSTQNYSIFFWFYSMSWPINQGLNYMIPIHHSWLWFPGNAGLVSGICLAGMGIGGAVFNIVSTKLINPENISVTDPTYEAMIKANFQHMLKSLLAMWMVLALIGILFIFRGPEPAPKPDTEAPTSIQQAQEVNQEVQETRDGNDEFDEEHYDPSQHCDAKEML